MPAEILIVYTLAGDEAWSRMEAIADPATYSPISSPDEPLRTSARNRGSPVVESVSRCTIRDCPDLAQGDPLGGPLSVDGLQPRGLIHQHRCARGDQAQ